MSESLLDLVRELNALNDDNLAARVIKDSDVQWCLSELQDILEAEKTTPTPPNEWVSVEDRLPEDDIPAGRKQITVMVATKAGKVTIASRVFEPERKYCGKIYPARWIWSRWLNNYATHWMRLPAPPGKDNNVPTKAPNEPLTWSELETMTNNPVYIVELEEPNRCYWALVHQVSRSGVMLTSPIDLHDYGSREFYGQSWLAYRHPHER